MNTIENSVRKDRKPNKYTYDIYSESLSSIKSKKK